MSKMSCDDLKADNMYNRILLPKYPDSLSLTPGNFSKFVKYYQFGAFYERELALWNENGMFRGKPLREYLFDNRLKYAGKRPDDLTDAEILRGFTISGILRGYTVFDASVMDDIIDDYAIKSVYDPCAGWGERMLCCASKGISYLGIDINNNLWDGYNYMIQDMDLVNCCFLTGDSSKMVISGDFDAVITCPPYFNMEHYSDCGAENMSYDDFLSWWEHIVKNSADHMNIRYFCFQINQKYRNDMSDIVERCGFCLIDARVSRSNRSSHFTRKKGVNSKKEFEVMLVFERL